jgi:hypothetical protein
MVYLCAAIATGSFPLNRDTKLTQALEALLQT